MPAVGDAILYGTGPQSTSTSVHVGIVTQVWPDGSIMSVGGDSGPGRDGYLSTALDGPFLPADSAVVQRRADLRLLPAVGSAPTAPFHRRPADRPVPPPEFQAERSAATGRNVAHFLGNSGFSKCVLPRRM